MPELYVDQAIPTQRLRGAAAPDARILVVEDDVDLMTVVTRVVKRIEPDIQVDWATAFDAALERLERRSYRLVLVDYHLAGSKSGLTLLGPCLERQPDAVFAMMSSLSFDELWQHSATRAFPFLRKPFTTEECLGFIGSAFR